MNALHLLGEQGGWPLTMFLTSDGEPFWGGTYFPKIAQYGRPASPLLRTVARLYRDEPDKIIHNRDALLAKLGERTRGDAARGSARRNSTTPRRRSRAPPIRSTGLARRAEVSAMRDARSSVRRGRAAVTIAFSITPIWR